MYPRIIYVYTVEDVLKRIEFDGVEYVRFEASNCNGQSFGKTVPVRHIKSTFENGLRIYCGTWFFTVLFGNAGDTAAQDITYRNSINFIYPDTYCVIPYNKQHKIARVMMHPMICIGNKLTKEVWPIDPRTICLQQLNELNNMGYSLLSSFEHEFQILDCNNAPLWTGKEYCSNNKFAQNENFAFKLDKYLYKMGIDFEVMHVEYSPGQYELPIKPKFGIYAADDSFTFRNSIKQIAHQNNLKATFATTPFPADMDGASNGAHFNFSLWCNNDKETKDNKDNKNNDDEKEPKKTKKNAFYDENADNRLSEIAMFFIGGILEHIDALTLFANITPNCYRRSNTHSWSPGNASYGPNNRSVALRYKTDGEDGTYMEYRLSSSACNPYMVTTSVIAAGIDGIKNRIKPKYDACTKDAWSKEYEKIPLVPKDISAAMCALKKDKIIWDAFGDRFCNMFIHTKEVEVKELETLAKELGQEAAETKMFLNI